MEAPETMVAGRLVGRTNVIDAHQWFDRAENFMSENANGCGKTRAVRGAALSYGGEAGAGASAHYLID